MAKATVNTSSCTSNTLRRFVVQSLLMLRRLLGNPEFNDRPAFKQLDEPGLYCPNVPPDFARMELFANTPRYAGLCVRDRCSSWKGYCLLGVAVTIASQPLSGIENPTAESCPIRSNCRWRLENGDETCNLCTSIVDYNLDESIDLVRMGVPTS
jgi:hypothetical protein